MDVTELASLNEAAASFHRAMEQSSGALTVRKDKMAVLEFHPHYQGRSDAEVIQMAKSIPGMRRRGQVILPITTRAMAIALLMGERELL